MVVRSPSTKAAEVRRKLGYPIVDADGHTFEYLPRLHEYMRAELGTKTFDRYLADHEEIQPKRTMKRMFCS